MLQKSNTCDFSNSYRIEIQAPIDHKPLQLNLELTTRVGRRDYWKGSCPAGGRREEYV